MDEMDEMDEGMALVPYNRGTGLEGARAWAELPPDELKRRAAEAAHTHDATALWSLAAAYLTVRGRARARVSLLTLRNYHRAVRDLVEAWPQENLLRPRRDAGALWAASLEDRRLAPSTISVRLAGARCLYAALRWSGATAADPFKDVKGTADTTPAWEKRKPYTEAEVRAMLDIAEGLDRALLLLGAHAGLRVSEAHALEWADINPGRSELVVRSGKGRKRRSVAMSPTLMAALDAVAPAPRQGRVFGRVSSRVALWRQMRRLALRAGVTPRGVHSLRHYCGTRIVREGGSLEWAARHLGHSQIETARVYAKWSDEGLKASLSTW